ncbi:unnamed protein product [Rotaria magnacalcarata]
MEVIGNVVRNPVVNGSRICLSLPEPGVSGKYPGNGDRKTFRNTASGIRWKITRSDSFPPYVFDLGIHEKKGFNSDATAKSKKVFKKIKAETNAESLLSPDTSLGILQLHDKLAQEMNSEGMIKGALQIVQFRPFCVVAFTETPIRLYDFIVNCPEPVLSWDATGGIVKNSSSKQCLYYELTMTHPNIIS